MIMMILVIILILIIYFLNDHVQRGRGVENYGKCCTAVHLVEAADVNENPIVYVKANDEEDRSCQMRVGSVVLWSISLEVQIQ